MATRGRKPSITLLQPLRGKRHPALGGEPMPGGTPNAPSNLSKEHRDIWSRYITPSFWLTRADEPKCIMFTYLMREYLNDPDNMPVTRIKQLRFLGSELGFDPPSRARMGRGQDDPFAEYK